MPPDETLQQGPNRSWLLFLGSVFIHGPFRVGKSALLTVLLVVEGYDKILVT